MVIFSIVLRLVLLLLLLPSQTPKSISPIDALQLMLIVIVINLNGNLLNCLRFYCYCYCYCHYCQYYYWITCASLSTTPSTRRSPSCPRIDCYYSNFCSFAATEFLLQSSSPSSLYFQVIFSGLQQCLRFMLSWFMALQELRPWRGASCHEHVVIAIGLVFRLVSH